jgi:hypothetical protein
VRAAYPLREPLLELPDERALGGNPARVDALVEVFLFVAVEDRFVDRDKISHNL